MDTFAFGLARLLGALPLAALSATTANPFMWYITRAAATSSYITLTLLVILGLARSMTRLSGARVSWWLDETHQFLALLTAGLVGLHLVSLLLDALIPFSIVNLLIPVAEPYRPFAVGVGVVTMYGMVAVLASSWLRRWLGHAKWRLIHYLSFAVFAGVTLHGILAGSDSGQSWMIFVYVASAISVSLLTFIRILSRPPAQPARADYGRR